jgi:hypothetical protein
MFKRSEGPRCSGDRAVHVRSSIDRRVRGLGDAFRDGALPDGFVWLDEQAGRLAVDFPTWRLSNAERADLKTRMRHLGGTPLSDTLNASR